MYNNLDYVFDKVSFDNSLKQEMKDLCCDPQTSGGLLLSLPEKDAYRLVERVNKSYCRIIGKAVKKKEKSVIFF